MKKLIALLLILALCLSLFACGSKSSKKDNDDDDKQTVEEDKDDEKDDGEESEDDETEASILPVVTEATEATEQTEATEETETAGSVSEFFAAYGMSEQDLLVHSQDYIEYDEYGDIILYTTASGEELAKAAYNACKKASDDGEVLDYWTEDPVEFSYEEDQWIYYSFMRDGKFKTLWVTSVIMDGDYMEYVISID